MNSGKLISDPVGTYSNEEDENASINLLPRTILTGIICFLGTWEMSTKSKVPIDLKVQNKAMVKMQVKIAITPLLGTLLRELQSVCVYFLMH